MSKKATIMLLSLAIATAISTTVNAMSINITLDSAIDNQFNFGYTVYDTKSAGNASTHKFHLEGVPVDKLQNIVAITNQALQDVEPGKSLNGELSTVSLSYIKSDGTVIAPTSCKIIATPAMNIFMNENGCTVS